MKPRRTHTSNQVYIYELAGGTEDNSLWVHADSAQGTVSSVWELTDEERAAIADGFNVQLTVWGGQPPVAMWLVNTPLSKPPEQEIPHADH